MICPRSSWFSAALCGTIAVHPVANVFKAFRLALSDKPSESDSRGRAVFQDASIFSAAAGLLGTLIGLVEMLLAIEDPDHIGHLLPLLY